ncbi:MAG: sigma-54 dependent transcriptional regulator [Deltaproteobacteria bacterium]|nr:sigma-54 dependent transcriptional regulator [Deltaproteobacteria bacterium]
MDSKHLLIVDDEAGHRQMLRAYLEDEGFEVKEAADGLQSVAAVRNQAFDLVLLDLKMPGMDGLEVLREIRSISEALPIIMMTAYGTIESAVEAIKAGAQDFVAKPLDMEELTLKIHKILRLHELEQGSLLQQARLDAQFDFSRIIGRSPAMLETFETLALVAPTEATVLILGESGTGKELVANAIHQNSPRRQQPLVKLNCAALQENLLESELFGHERGAFTGAVSRKEGRFQQADGGTIFLDEIGDMSFNTQAKMLRVLQEKEFEPVGATRTIKVDVRVIAATNKDLLQEVQSGRFREDLYYRLNVVSLTIPPLRERREDIPLLAEYFLKVYAEKNRRTIKGLEPAVLDAFQRYQWPGNVRELENAVERAVIMCPREYLRLQDLPLTLHSLETEGATGEMAIKAGLSMREMEKQLILKTLEETQGNKSKAARQLGISRRTLLNKLAEYDIGSESAEG